MRETECNPSGLCTAYEHQSGIKCKLPMLLAALKKNTKQLSSHKMAQKPHMLIFVINNRLNLDDPETFRLILDVGGYIM